MRRNGRSFRRWPTWIGGGSLFVVGDPKQSIYQFRGADVSVFNCVRKQFAALESARELPLSKSFRSHRPLIEQFNALFSQILIRDEDSAVKDYEVEFDKPMSADRANPPALPAITIQLLDSDALDEAKMRRDRLPGDTAAIEPTTCAAGKPVRSPSVSSA